MLQDLAFSLSIKENECYKVVAKWKELLGHLTVNKWFVSMVELVRKKLSNPLLIKWVFNKEKKILKNFPLLSKFPSFPNATTTTQWKNIFQEILKKLKN